jgi:hypothetical protein
VIEKYGRKGTEHDGIFFTEGVIEGGSNLGIVEAVSNQQNMSLDKLKSDLAAKVKSKGGNALDEFKYVQKGTVFSFSSTQWRASGRAIKAE